MNPSSLRLASAAFLLSTAFATFSARAQNVPLVNTPTPYQGFLFPNIGGSLQYSLTAAESVILGYNGQPGTGANAVTSFSGDLAYLSKSEHSPFSAVYSGGYLIGTSNQPSYVFQNLALSQVIDRGPWNFTVADSVSYLPQTPLSGLSGIPGVGDLTVAPVQVGSDVGLGILTEYGSRVTNLASGSLTRRLTPSTSLSGTGDYTLTRFISSSSSSGGIDSDSLGASATLQHRIDARDTLGASYTYSTSTFQGSAVSGLSYNTQSVNLQYTRNLTRQVVLSLAAGPQRVSSSSASTLTAPSTNVSANAALGFSGRVYTTGLAYSRGVNNGDGISLGARSDVISFSTQRRLGPVWNIAGTVGFNHSTQLSNSTFPSFTSEAVVASAQASRQLGKVFSLFISYTLQRQLLSGNTPGLNAFNGLSQVVGFGVSYSPRPFLGRK